MECNLLRYTIHTHYRGLPLYMNDSVAFDKPGNFQTFLARLIIVWDRDK
jgi:hypothetical protein